MDAEPLDDVRRGEVVVPCTELDAALAVLRPLGFRLESIFPADAPAIAVVTGHGVRLRLERGAAAPAPVVRLTSARAAPAGGEPGAASGGARELELPGGARIQLVEEARGLEVPPLAPSYVVVRGPTGAWGAGRVGMQYRDLLPDRQGGRFIASHIRIPGGGLVPDYVHYHTIRFQIIYCHRGWVRALYEDQGEAFQMEEGDCVLQPPRIRHRVLECSAGFEAIEVGSPARQETRADHELELPSPVRVRDYDGQRFVMSRAAAARWEPARHPGWRARDLGVAAASGGLVSAQVLRPAEPGVRLAETGAGELLWGCVLRGAATLDGAHRLEAADAFAVPAGRPFELADATADLEWMLVTVP